MDSVNLRQELDLLAIEYQRRSRAAERLDDLLPLAVGLEASARHLNIPDFIAVALMRRAEVLAGLGRNADVIAVLEQARSVLGDWRKQDLGVRVLGLLAEAYARRSDWPKVSELCGEGIELAEAFRYKVSSQYLQSGYLRYRIGLYAQGVRAAFELRQFDQMLQRAELSKCRSMLRHQPDSSAPTKPSTVEQQFVEVCRQIDTARSRGRDVADLAVKRRTLWDLLVIERLQARADISLPDFSLSAFQPMLAPDESVLYYYWVSHDALLIVLLDAQECRAELRQITPTQRQQLESFASRVVNFKGENRGLLDEVADFTGLLIPDGAALRWTGKKRLLISPHRLLHSVPFHALRWEGAWLIEHFAITCVPNLTSLLLRHSRSNQPDWCLIGTNDYAVPGHEKELPPLPQAEVEVAAIARICAEAGIPATTLLGAGAREEQLHDLHANGALGRFSCLHFALHGENLNADTPMESHLFLRDSLLDGLEIANWKLNADLVVLSACCSGQRAIAGRGLAELPGDEMFGLTAAFFAAGARRIFSTLWPVDSYAAVPITTALHRHLVGGAAPEFAWQEAVRGYLKNAGPLKRKIYYWAPFFLSAVGRPEKAASQN